MPGVGAKDATPHPQKQHRGCAFAMSVVFSQKVGDDMKTRMIPALAVAGMLAGCANIGSVNQRAQLSTQNDDRYCVRHPERCILFGVIVIGVIGALMDQSGWGGSSTSSGSSGGAPVL
ncbi:hypothetical protein ACS3SW_17790 [Roseobacteraceae bacterium S113]